MREGPCIIISVLFIAFASNILPDQKRQKTHCSFQYNFSKLREIQCVLVTASHMFLVKPIDLTI